MAFGFGETSAGWRRGFFWAIASVLLTAFAPVSGGAAAERLVFVTDWTAQAEQGGFYQAQAEGLYAQKGLDLVIRQGGPQTNVAQLIAAGAVDLAIASNGASVLNFVKEGAPVKAVMASFQKDPTVLIAHPDQGIARPEDLKGRPILFSSTSLTTLWPWLKLKYGFEDRQIRPYTFNLAPFLLDKGLVQEGYLGSEPYEIEREGGFKPVVFLLADFGYSGYSAMVVARTEVIEKHPEAVRAFVAASIQGWKDYLHGDPAPGNRLIKANNPEMTDALIASSIATLKAHGIAEGGDGAKDHLGVMTDRRWQEFLAQAIAMGLAAPGLDIRQGYSLDFLPAGSQPPGDAH